MDSEAQNRRERLKALAQARQRQTNASDASHSAGTKRPLDPSDDHTLANRDGLAQPGVASQGSSPHPSPSTAWPKPSVLTGATVEQATTGVAERTLAAENARKQHQQSQSAANAGAIDLQQLAPQKPNWDLKRDLQKKLDKLEPKTQAALAELIRQRVQPPPSQSAEEGVNIASAGSSSTTSRSPSSTARADNQANDSESLNLADAVQAQENLQRDSPHSDDTMSD
ncbi:hypothetical protein H4R33_005615 [Dimargaris cristalligena]|uniref:Cwf18 pre-mRNA splicing factor-domain-containing protein n=1 Tax=Dimargaris cristalligena TaxID=215637 RepID=A0A4P9ZTY0_9FUNG|nr:hypothetical protein H4R33_005615 [Dimargaris cristalligena]RKP36030.1 cwf18 pre-mRNA splicing factor-domain-containing protein [Dimargaris cristalligena]|eukprot:RKP36030.1 cwf18 pre-mRNA splicing factor-domain-containing protein [Dimargaris cristalligena]